MNTHTSVHHGAKNPTGTAITAIAVPTHTAMGCERRQTRAVAPASPTGRYTSHHTAPVSASSNLATSKVASSSAHSTHDPIAITVPATSPTRRGKEGRGGWVGAGPGVLMVRI